MKIKRLAPIIAILALGACSTSPNEPEPIDTRLLHFEDSRGTSSSTQQQAQSQARGTEDLGPEGPDGKGPKGLDPAE